jgi:leucyl/phenylalanyl-tRNA--protein transferase
MARGHLTRWISPDVLLAGYARGIFPMADEVTREIRWYSADPRGILPLDAFHPPRSLRQLVRKHTFTVRVNTAFEEVIRGCASRDQTWISEEIIQSYLRLHQFGHAHSVEAWQGETLAGGLYGVALGGAFFGESMFTVVSGASKVCLVSLVERLRERGFSLLDTQFVTPHLAGFGAREVPRAEYLALLAGALDLPATFA